MKVMTAMTPVVLTGSGGDCSGVLAQSQRLIHSGIAFSLNEDTMTSIRLLNSHTSLLQFPRYFRGQDGFASITQLRSCPHADHHSSADGGLVGRADSSGSQLVDRVAVLLSDADSGRLAVAGSGSFPEEPPNSSAAVSRSARDVAPGGEPLDSADD